MKQSSDDVKHDGQAVEWTRRRKRLGDLTEGEGGTGGAGQCYGARSRCTGGRMVTVKHQKHQVGRYYMTLQPCISSECRTFHDSFEWNW